MSKKTYIYGLFCPISNEIKYIGKSNDPKGRLRKHNQLSDNNTLKNDWIKSLQDIGLSPILKIIEETSVDNWKEREKFHIGKNYSSLFNLCGGGNGLNFGNQTSFKGRPFIKVVCLNRMGELVNTFESIKAGREFAGCRIYNTLIGKRKSAGGYLWLYEDKYLKMSKEDLLNFVNECNMNRSIPTLVTNGIKTRYKKGQKPKSCKKIDQFDLGGNYIRSWNDSADASLFYTGKRRSAISNCIRGKCKSALGYIWKLSSI